MNFFNRLSAHDFPAFDLIPNAIPSAAISNIYNNIIADLPASLPGQSGAVLTKFNNKLHTLLRPLEDTISRKFHRRMYLRLDKSSYRTQLPSGEAALSLHQDYLALRDVRKKWLRRPHTPWHYYSDPAKESCCTVWVPLVDIDEVTPTLEVCSRLPRGFVEHKPDAAGYLIILSAAAAALANDPLVAFTRLAAGTGVFLTSLTLHRSCVRPWHTRTRTSFDLRFLPRGQP
jgi:hypothetical protein